MGLFGKALLMLSLTSCSLTSSQNHLKSKSDIVVMVRPTYFGSNPETIETNRFASKDTSQAAVHKKAMDEYRKMVQLLRKNEISVIDLPAPHPKAPDAVFPNNWFTLHTNPKEKKNILTVYPMLNKSRQLETKNIPRLIESLKSHRVMVDELVDLTSGQALEGTGVLVGAHSEHKHMYVGQSPRAHLPLAKKVAKSMGKKLITYQTADRGNNPIYHTNVLHGETQSVHIVCLEAIHKKDQEKVLQSFSQTGRPVVTITLEQMENMCGNVIELVGDNGQKYLLMSQRASDHFTSQQKKVFDQAGLKIISPDISTIEKVGGGSARCMVAMIQGHLKV